MHVLKIGRGLQAVNCATCGILTDMIKLVMGKLLCFSCSNDKTRWPSEVEGDE